MKKQVHSGFDAGSGSEPAPVSIPDHEFLRCIGWGSYGEVWLARNAVGTPRAIKIVRRDRFDHAADFEREFKGLQCFEPVSRTHEGLSGILSLGRLPGTEGFFYVMELADDADSILALSGAEAHQSSGTSARPERKTGLLSLETYSPFTLRAALRARTAIPFDRLLALGLKLTAAVAHLHAQGLVHRDIKPSNILFVNGEPKLADAGLVAVVDDARSLVGTAGYIAPEGPGTPNADLYALGKVLYEAAFGKDRQDFPQLPPDLQSRPDHAGLLEFNAILLKACATNPLERYQSADEMRGDLELLLTGRSVKRRQRWRRTLTLATKVLLAGAAVASITAIVYLLAPRSQREPAVKKSPIAEANDEYKMGINELHANLNAEQAINHFEKATRLDPNFADAYAQLADAWFSIPGENSKDKGTKAAAKAISLDPQSGLAQVFFAASKMFALDFTAALKGTERAVKLSPNSEEVLLASALIFSTMGHTNEALANLKKAMEVGQDTPSKLRLIYSGFVYYWCRDYDNAIAIYNKTPWLKDGVDGPHHVQSLAYLAKDDYANSMRLDRQSELERGGTEKTAEVNAHFDALDRAFKEGGAEQYWTLKLKFETPKTDDQHLMRMAGIHARLGQRAEALNYLRRAMAEEPLYFGANIYTDPNLDGLRNEAEFKELMAGLWRKK